MLSWPTDGGKATRMRPVWPQFGIVVVVVIEASSTSRSVPFGEREQVGIVVPHRAWSFALSNGMKLLVNGVTGTSSPVRGVGH